MQQNIYSNFIKDFDADEVSLAQQDVQFSEDRKRDWEKREKEENKRIEKLLRKDAADVEDLFNAFATSANKAQSLKTLRDKIAKSIGDIAKHQKQQLGKQLVIQEQEKIVAKIREDINKNLGKKNMLSSLSKGLLQRNSDLYLKHEQMLEEEKAERQKLAANFSEQMKEVTQELEVQK